MAGAQGLSWAALLVAISVLAPSRARAAWGMVPRFKVERPAPPDQSWLMDVPERPGAPPRGRVAVFAFAGDEVYQPVRAAVVRVLRRRHLSVTTSLKSVTSAVEYREMSHEVNLAVYVHGELSGEGARQSVLVHLYSGVTGRRVASVRFSGPTEKIVGDVGRTFWTRVGPTITRACTSVSRPRRLEREPLRIDAGEPGDAEGT